MGMASGERSSGKGFGRWAAGSASVGFASLAVLLMLGSAAAGVAPAKVVGAPYTSAHVILKNPVSASGCGGGALQAKAFFNKTSGIGGFSDNASTTWCTSYTNNSALEEGSFQVSLPIHVKTTGNHTVTAIWLTIATGSVNLTAGTCTGSATALYSGCTRSAAAFVYGTAYILDKVTNVHIKLSNKWAGNSTYVSNYTSCIYTKCTSTASKHQSNVLNTGSAYWAWYWNSTALNATHNYTLKMTIYGGVYVRLMTNGATLSGASADAQLNSATLGNEEDLVQYSVV